MRKLILALFSMAIVMNLCANGGSEKAAVPAEDVVLKIMRGHVSTDPETEPSIAILNEKTGIETVWEFLPQQNPVDKLNLVLSAGEEYDYIMLSNGQRYILGDYSSKGIIQALDDKIGAYPRVAALPEKGWKSVTIDGKRFAIPSTGLPIPKASNWIREDILKDAGLSLPQTGDELLSLLRELKDYTTEKGVVMSFPGSTGIGILPSLSGAFGFLYGYEIIDGKVVDNRLTPAYKEYLSFLNKLWEEGIIDPDMPVMNREAWKTKVGNGDVIFYPGWIDGSELYARNMTAAGTPEKGFIPMVPLMDSRGERIVLSESGAHNFGMIPTSSDNVKTTLMWLNTMLEEKTWQEITIGMEGTDWEFKNGKRYPILPKFFEERGNMWAFLPVQDGEQYFPLWITRVRKSPEYALLFDKLVEATEKYQVDNVLNFLPVGAVRGDKGKIIEDYYAIEALNFVVGTRSMDEFDAYAAEAKRLGALEIVKEIQSQLNS